MIADNNTSAMTTSVAESELGGDTDKAAVQDESEEVDASTILMVSIGQPYCPPTTSWPKGSNDQHRPNPPFFAFIYFKYQYIFHPIKSLVQLTKNDASFHFVQQKYYYTKLPPQKSWPHFGPILGIFILEHICWCRLKTFFLHLYLTCNNCHFVFPPWGKCCGNLVSQRFCGQFKKERIAECALVTAVMGVCPAR